MRIQHNIMAMGAYRNYTNNLSAMQKNLEKLSSGYKINRAGDDAAGLAISEKMRAQITGLNTAQKNAKDGISLVQTAEGALTEVHDMLNRMVTLSTQSANGTYDNETDRVQLQKELDQLLSEINRIADSSNFNGIQLLDGSMSAEGVQPVSSKFELPAVGSILGTDTVLHQDEDEASASTYFGLDLHNMKFSGEAGASFTIKIGNTELVGELVDDGTVTGEDMVAALTGDTSKLTFTVDGNALDPSKVMIDNREYRIEAGTHQTTGGGGEKTGAIFKLNNTESGVDVSFDVSITDNTPTGAAKPTTPSLTGTASINAEAVSSAGGLDGNGRTNATASVNEYKTTGRIDKDAVTLALKDSITDNTTGAVIATVVSGESTPVKVVGTNATYEFSFSAADIDQIQKIVDDLNTATAGSVGTGDLTISYNGAATGGEKIELKIGSKVIATADETALSTSGTTFKGTNASNTTFGSITVTDTSGSWNSSTDPATDLTAATLTGTMGASTATIKTSTAANTTTLETEAITAAAAKKGVAAGDVKLTYSSTNDRLELQINGETIGYADKEQVNQEQDLYFTDDDGNDLGYITLANNGEMDASNIDDLDTGLDYADANLKYTLGTVDHEKLAAAIKDKAVNSSADYGSDIELDLSHDGTDFILSLNGEQISTSSSISAGVVDIKDSSGATLLSFTLSDTSIGNVNKLADDTDHSSFTDIGIKVTLAPVTKATVDTTDLGTNADAIAKAATEAAAAEGIDITDLDGESLTVSYNKTAGQYELKIKDLVVGTGSGTLSGNTNTVAFTSADGTTLGNVTIDNLKTDFEDEDLVGEIDTDIKFNADATPAINADYTGLDQDALKQFAKDNGVADGAKLEAIFDQGSKNWTLQFNDGTTTTQVATATLTDGDESIEFTDFGTVSFSDAIDTTTFANLGLTPEVVTMDTGLQYKETELDSGLKGDFLVTASNQMNTNSTGGDRLASTVLTLTSDMVTDGASLFVAGKTYTFSTGKDTVVADGAVKVDISDLDSSSDSYMSDVVKRLTAAYNDDNTGVYTLGWNGKNVTVTETMTHGMLKDNGSSVADGTYAADEWDLTTFDGIKKSLGYSTAASKGSSLTLQIGDTAEKFNQLEVNIKDCHAAAMGLDGLDISTQAAAAESVDKIKAAINYVSDVRGTLGATQNRLDHTINNLSVMTENIQDAESTIRDTDVAEEMMAYTKNNILIQSAQAMLAQANQVPQGVLQLLQ